MTLTLALTKMTDDEEGEVKVNDGKGTGRGELGRLGGRSILILVCPDGPRAPCLSRGMDGPGLARAGQWLFRRGGEGANGGGIGPMHVGVVGRGGLE